MARNTSRRRTVAALLLTLTSLACDKPQPPPPSAGSATPSLTLASSGPLEGLTAPDDVVLFGGADVPSRLLQTLLALNGDDAGPRAGQLGHDAAGAVATRFGLRDGAALDLDRRLRVALFDPTAHREPWLVAVATHGRNQLIASLPEGRRAGAGKSDYSWPLDEGSAYLTFIQDYAVFSGDEALAAKGRAFMTTLLAAELGSDVALRVSGPSVARLSPEPAADAGSPRAPAWHGLARALSANIDSVLLQARVVDGGLSLRVGMKPRAGSDTAAIVGGLGALAPADELPAEAALAVTLRLDPDRDDALTRAATAWALQLGDADAATKDERYERARRDFWKATTGEIGFALHALDEKSRDACSAWLPIRDAGAARAAMTTLRGRPQHDPALAKMYRDEGMLASFTEEAFRVGEVKVDEVKVSLSDAARSSGAPDAAARMLTSMLHSHAAVSADRALITFGDDGERSMRAWLEGRVAPRRHAALEAVLKSAPKGTFAAGLLSPGALLALLPQADSDGAAPSSRAAPVSMVASASGGVLHFTVRVDRGQMAALAALLTGLRRRF